MRSMYLERLSLIENALVLFTRHVRHVEPGSLHECEAVVKGGRYLGNFVRNEQLLFQFGVSFTKLSVKESLHQTAQHQPLPGRMASVHAISYERNPTFEIKHGHWSRSQSQT